MSRYLLPLFLVACQGSSIKIGDGVDTGNPDESDADTDADSDTDTDADTDSGDTGDTGGPVLPEWDWYVDCNGGGDFTTIQEAIENATSGDRIALAPCEYHERIDYLGKYLDIFGVEGSANTTIDADYTGTAVNVETAESGGTRLAGVSIEDGYDPADGSALEVYYASLELEDVVFAGNGEGHSVASLTVGFVDMIDVVFEDNEIGADGQAILSDGGSFSATRVRADCGAGAYALYQHDATLILDSELTCAGGYGLLSYHGEIQVKRSRIEGGIAGIYAYDEDDTPSERAYVYNSVIGGGAEGAKFEYMTVYLANNVIYGTDAGVTFYMNSSSSWIIANAIVGAACGVSSDVPYSVSYNAFWQNAADTCGTTATNSVTADPRFAAFPDDVTPAGGSPLLDAGYPNASWDDLDGSRNDIGVTGGPWAE